MSICTERCRGPPLSICLHSLHTRQDVSVFSFFFHVLSFCSFFLLQLIDPMPIMLWVAAIVEFALGNALDGGILVFINLANASISYVGSLLVLPLLLLFFIYRIYCATISLFLLCLSLQTRACK